MTKLWVRVSPAIATAVHTAAQRRGQPISAWLRDCIMTTPFRDNEESGWHFRSLRGGTAILYMRLTPDLCLLLDGIRTIRTREGFPATRGMLLREAALWALDTQ